MPYTVVQHSGVTTGHDEFAQGLEPKSVTDKQAAKVTEAGGLIFPDYAEADDYCEREMYPPHYEGLVPAAPGRFNLLLKFDGLPVYLP